MNVTFRYSQLLRWFVIGEAVLIPVKDFNYWLPYRVGKRYSIHLRSKRISADYHLVWRSS